MAEDPDVAFVLEAFQAFDVQEGTLEEYHARFWVPDGVIEFVDGFPISGRYEGLEGYRQWFADSYAPYEDVELEVQLGNTYELADGRIKRLNVYVGHERAVAAALGGG